MPRYDFMGPVSHSTVNWKLAPRIARNVIAPSVFHQIGNCLLSPLVAAEPVDVCILPADPAAPDLHVRMTVWTLWHQVFAPQVQLRIYLRQWPSKTWPAVLRQQVAQALPILAKASAARRTLWLGSGGAFTPCHSDDRDNLIAQLAGYKHYRLAPPASLGVRSSQDIVLGEGDVLFLPAGWYHEVEALDPSLTLNACAD
jgi:hypothetical protein